MTDSLLSQPAKADCDNPPSSRLSDENERVGKAENNAKINYYCQWNQGVGERTSFHIVKIRPADVAF
jgi:hypothetical protein